jgi:hypothetical protein
MFAARTDHPEDHRRFPPLPPYTTKQSVTFTLPKKKMQQKTPNNHTILRLAFANHSRAPQPNHNFHTSAQEGLIRRALFP